MKKLILIALPLILLFSACGKEPDIYFSGQQVINMGYEYIEERCTWFSPYRFEKKRPQEIIPTEWANIPISGYQAEWRPWKKPTFGSYPDSSDRTGQGTWFISLRAFPSDQYEEIMKVMDYGNDIDNHRRLHGHITWADDIDRNDISASCDEDHHAKEFTELCPTCIYKYGVRDFRPLNKP